RPEWQPDADRVRADRFDNFLVMVDLRKIRRNRELGLLRRERKGACRNSLVHRPAPQKPAAAWSPATLMPERARRALLTMSPGRSSSSGFAVASFSTAA